MKHTLNACRLMVKKSPIHGYGVFAAQTISAGATIEECHVVNVGEGQRELWDYYFNKGNEERILVLGNGSIYNHANQPNAKHVFDLTNQLMVFSALKPIGIGEEICISYGKSWFDARELNIKTPSLWFRVRRQFKRCQWLFRFALVTSFGWLVLHLVHP
jgi:SET domain-containing protein